MSKKYIYKVHPDFVRVTDGITYQGDIFNREGRLYHNLNSHDPIRYFKQRYLGIDSQEFTSQLWELLLKFQS